MNNQKSPQQVIDAATDYLRDLRYSPETVKEYKVAWAKIVKFAREQGIDYFSQRLLDDFKCAKKLLTFKKNYCRTPKGELYRAVRVLKEFTSSGFRAAKASYRQKPCYPPFIETTLPEIREYMSDELNLAPSTIYCNFRWFEKYLLHRLSRSNFNAWSDLTPADTSSFIRSLSHLSLRTKSRAMQSVRAVLRVLFVLGKVREPLHKNTPRLQKMTDGPLRPIWPVAEVKTFLATVDRDTAIGKRDYAIFLLAARLGLRATDIRALTLDDLNWEKSRLEMVQQKTRRALTLPLPQEVGRAIIDYLQNGRPASPYREVFLRRYAPFGPLCLGRNFSHEVRRYRQLAHLPLMPGMGLHSLRHTLATRLLESGVPVQDIAAVLGHGDIESTRPYLRVSLETLRQAALEPDEEVTYA